MARRTLGVGVINFANYLAQNNVRYSDGSANGLTLVLLRQFSITC